MHMCVIYLIMTQLSRTSTRKLNYYRKFDLFITSRIKFGQYIVDASEFVRIRLPVHVQMTVTLMSVQYSIPNQQEWYF